MKYVELNGLDETYMRALDNRIVYEILYIGLNELNRQVGVRSHIAAIKSIMNSDKYEKARRGFCYKKFPIHWRLFYSFAVNKKACFLYGLLYIMKKARDRRH